MSNTAKVVIALTWILPIGGVAAGSCVLVLGLSTATGAPQEAVVCTLACTCAILPYCFARAITEIITVCSGEEKAPAEAAAVVTDSKPKYNYQSIGVKAE